MYGPDGRCSCHLGRLTLNSLYSLYSMLYFRLLDPRIVDSGIVFTKYVSEWATNLPAISLNVGVTTFGPPCMCSPGDIFCSMNMIWHERTGCNGCTNIPVLKLRGKLMTDFTALVASYSWYSQKSKGQKLHPVKQKTKARKLKLILRTPTMDDLTISYDFIVQLSPNCVSSKGRWYLQHKLQQLSY